MNSKRLFYILSGCLALAFIAIVGVAYGANIVLAAQSKKLATAKAQSQDLSNRAEELSKNKNDIVKYAELNKIAESVVPQDKDQAEAVREIVSLASQSGISQLSSITFPASSLGTTGLSATGIKNLSGITQVTPVKGIPGVYDLQITIALADTKTIPYNQFLNFLSRLEQNRRTAQVSSITVTPDTKNTGNVSFTLNLDEFIKP